MASVGWVPPELHQFDEPQLLTVRVPENDLDLVALLADGHLDVEVPAPGTATKESIGFLRFCGFALKAELTKSLVERKSFGTLKPGEALRLHCCGIVRTPSDQPLAVALALERWPTPLLLPRIREQAVVLVTQHRAAKAAKAAEAALAAMKDEELLETLPPDQRERYKCSLGTAATMRAATGVEPPLIAPETLLRMLPIGLAVDVTSADPAVVGRAVTVALHKAPIPDHPPPREGHYKVLVTGAGKGTRSTALVTWVPHRGLPPYVEVRAAAERRLPKAFLTPRMTGAQPPDLSDLPGVTAIGANTSQVNASPFDPHDPAWLEALDGSGEFDFPNRADMAGAARSAVQRLGFEAIAWYQPHHFYDEGAWGIYLDAHKLDELTCCLAMDLRREGICTNTDALAGKLAVGLVLEHEHFHAKLEAALTWVELHAGHPKFLRYQQDVYAAVRGTEDWLEEALANYWSWAWFSAESMMAELGGALAPAQREAMNRVVESLLDLAPAGYRHWREGRRRESWRILATQAAQGRPRLPPPGIGLPLEPTLRDPLPFDYRATDVPLRVVGFGQVAHRLFSSPATLNRPARRELRSAITRHFGYEQVPGGKGSHEKFKGGDGRMFPLPQRDPVSQEVFSAFLEHFNLTKSDYINRVRPTL